MRLRTWLLLSYLIVMILPLGMAYFLFAWINSINSEQRVQEYFEVYLETQQTKELLANPKLYTTQADYSKIDSYVNDYMSITLYDENGHVLYNPYPDPIVSVATNKKVLYRGLYSLEQGYRAFTYKEPVYEKDTIIGFFEVTFSRNEWMTNVSNRTIIVSIIFLGSFVLLYLIVILFVNGKLNKRIERLMDDMSAFAQGEMIDNREAGSDEIGELTEHFYSMRKQINDAREVIAEEQEMKAYMIATISHDLKTPLTSIKAYTEMLKTEKNLSQDERATYEQVIIGKTDFMKQMLDDLLMYTLLQSPTYDLEFVIVDGEEFFEMLTSGYEPLSQSKGVNLYTSTNVVGQFNVSPKQLIRVTDNLMSNAIKHTEENTNIWLGAYSNLKESMNWLFPFVEKEIQFNFVENVYLIVQNEGKGIEKDKLDHIFDPLYQVDQARSKKDDHGTGLGLSITKQIIEKHGGKVFVLSEVDVGTCIVCEIPKYFEGVVIDEKN